MRKLNANLNPLSNDVFLIVEKKTFFILAEEIAKVLKATFAKAMASNPAAAAEMARSMAEALAATGIFPKTFNCFFKFLK